MPNDCLETNHQPQTATLNIDIWTASALVFFSFCHCKNQFSQRGKFTLHAIKGTENDRNPIHLARWWTIAEWIYMQREFTDLSTAIFWYIYGASLFFSSNKRSDFLYSHHINTKNFEIIITSTANRTVYRSVFFLASDFYKLWVRFKRTVTPWSNWLFGTKLQSH